MNGSALTLHPRNGITAPEEDLGELLTCEEIATEILRRADKAAWVRKYMPEHIRVKISRERLCYRKDAEQWIKSLRGGGR